VNAAYESPVYRASCLLRQVVNETHKQRFYQNKFSAYCITLALEQGWGT